MIPNEGFVSELVGEARRRAVSALNGRPNATYYYHDASAAFVEDATQGVGVFFVPLALVPLVEAVLNRACGEPTSVADKVYPSPSDN